MREMQTISYELSAHAYQTNQNTVAKYSSLSCGRKGMDSGAKKIIHSTAIY